MRAPRVVSGKDGGTKGDERRFQLLQMGLSLFGDRSYAEISIDDIAAAADISRGLLYHYFKSKRGFYTATVQYAAEQLVERVQTDPDLDPEARTRAGIAAYLDYVETFAGAYAVLLRGGLGVDEHVNVILEATREAIVDQMITDSEELERTPVVHAALRGWLHLVEGMSLDYMERKEMPRDKLIDVLTNALWNMLESTVGGTFPR